MIKPGLIVSIQKYSQFTTQELSEFCETGGAVAIRTDHPIDTELPIIGLRKIPNKKYYITTSFETISQVAAWAEYIAIDCRRGNRELALLLSYCHMNDYKIVADIGALADFEYLIETCKALKINMPCIIATTFSKNNKKIIEDIRKIQNIPVIAEGGYYERYQILQAINYGADYVCIGAAISDIKLLTEKYVSIINGANECSG